MNTVGQPAVPAYSIEQAGGDALVAFVDANPAAATFDFVPQGDILTDFSLRGPIAGTLANLTKPDITGPGESIYAAVPTSVVSDGYASISGTSMSSPHAAGAATLVRAVQPSWTPAEVKSALMMTAFTGGTKENGTTPWDADDVGHGRLDLTRAARAGMVMNETTANFLAANPGSGGDVRTLNLPSLRNVSCSPTCQWTRTVRNTLTTPSTWTATGIAGNPGFGITVSPDTFSFTGPTLPRRGGDGDMDLRKALAQVFDNRVLACARRSCDHEKLRLASIAQIRNQLITVVHVQIHPRHSFAVCFDR